MPTSSQKRGSGKHYGNRVHHTGNKFIITSREAKLLEATLNHVQSNMMLIVGSLHERLQRIENFINPAKPQGEAPENAEHTKVV